MRRRLYREDHATGEGRMLLDTAWPDGPVPLMLARSAYDDEASSMHDGSTLIGKVTDIERAEDGWVTGVLTTTQKLEGLACEADFRGGEITLDKSEVVVVVGAQLTGVHLGKRPTWDGMVLK